MILTVTLNPCVHKYLSFRALVPEQKVLRDLRSDVTSGGKGLNVARVLQSLGGDVHALSTAGGPIGELLRECLAREGIAATLVPVAEGTRLSICLWDEAREEFREFLEQAHDLDAAVARALEEAFAELLPRASWVTLNGSTPGASLDGLWESFCLQARRLGKPVILDSYGLAAARAAATAPDWIRCNRWELETTYGVDIEEGLAGFFATHQPRGLRGVLVTDGPERIRCLTQEGSFVVHPPRVKEVNPVGCGDAHTAAFALALSRGENLATALKWGAAAGSATAVKLRVCELDRATFLRLVDEVVIEGP